MIFLYFFQPGGTLDAVAAAVRVQHGFQQWLGDPDLINSRWPALSVWRYLGLNFVLFLGAIQSIPGELYEAAEIDGANGWQQFRYIIAARHPADHRTDLHPGRIRVPVRVRDPVHHDRRGQRQRDVRDPDRQLAFKFNKFGLASAWPWCCCSSCC